MKIFNRILKVGLLIFIASCQPDEIKINTGPLFPGAFSVEGTNNSNGEAVSKPMSENETGIPINSSFTIGFSKAVDPATVVVTLTQDGTPVDLNVNVEGETITVDPTADLQFGTRYTLAVDKSIKAADGGVLLDALSKSFTTETQVPTIYEGQIFYMPFDGDYKESVTGTDATVVGSPGFAGEGIVGDSYAGATDSYLTFPAAGLHSNAISASFWLKVNAVPDRAGVLVIGPPDPNLPATPNNRTAGFRFFRENASGKQRFKLNVGNGTADSWFDGGAAADVDPAVDTWVHFAFTISETEAVVYINGEVVSQGSFSGISWEGCDILSIMSGAPRFTEWGHLSDESYMDELRIFNKALTKDDIEAIISAERYNGQTLYMPFDGNYKDVVSSADATVVGSPGFAGEAVIGSDSYEGAADSYLTFPTSGLQGDEFSAAFWLKVNAMPDRGGVLVMGPPDPNLPATPNNRTAGFRFFRENASGMQRFKLNVGTGTSDTWFDGGAAADVDPTTDEWVHFAFTISQTEAVVYINGQVVSQGPLAGVSWEGCDILSIMSGAPRFTEWGHLSDESFMDELHLFNRALTQGQVQAIMDDR
jgi:hypothetical protein